jgi:hypothetical protein
MLKHPHFALAAVGFGGVSTAHSPKSTFFGQLKSQLVLIFSIRYASRRTVVID